MKHKILKKAFTFISPLFLTIPFLTTSSIGLNNKQAATVNKEHEENKLFVYNNQIFTSKDQLLKYYLKMHPEAISSKSVIGNIDNAIIDYDDGILNPFKLPDYDLSKIKPVYRKSNGERTSSFADAKLSYANVVMIKKMYEGVTRLFPDENEAKAQRDNLIRPINMAYYDDVPNPLYGKSPLKINPLNENDVKTYQDIFASILNDENYQRVNAKYRRSFEVDTSKLSDEYKSLFDKNTKEPTYFINKFHNSIDEALKDNNQYVGNIDGLNNDGVHSIYRKNLPKKDDSPDRVDVEGSPDKDAHMDDTVDNISLSFFEKNVNLKNYLKFYKKTDAGPDDSMDGYSNVEIIKRNGNDNEKNNYTLNQKDINALLDKDNKGFQKEFGEIKISSKKGNNWIVNANNSDSFKKFIESGIEIIKKLREVFGTQFSAAAKVDLVKNNNNFEGLHVKLNDDAETGADNDNSFWVLGVDLNKFKFSWRFKLKKEIFTNLIPNLISKISEDDNHWKDDLYKRIKDKLKNPFAFKQFLTYLSNSNKSKIIKKDIEVLNEKDINALNSLIDKKEIQNIFKDNIKEYINFYNGSKETKMFLIERTKNNKEDKKEEKDIKVNSVFTQVKLESLVNAEILGEEKEDHPLKRLVHYILRENKINNEGLSEPISLGELKKLVNVIAKNLTYKEGKTDLSGDTKQTTALEQDSIMPIFIQQIVNYIKATQSDLSKDESLQNSPFLKNIILDFKNPQVRPLLFKDGISPFSVKNGAYLLISDVLFNGSIINKTGDGNINQNGIFDTQKDLEKQRKIVLSSRPPVVRVMYNLNGEIILGNNKIKNKEENKQDKKEKSKQEAVLYDSQSMVLEEAKVIAAPRKDPQYIFYQKTRSQEILLLNKVSNIYVLKDDGKAPRYFLSHKYLIQYLMKKLLDPEEGHVQIITTKDI